MIKVDKSEKVPSPVLKTSSSKDSTIKSSPAVSDVELSPAALTEPIVKIARNRNATSIIFLNPILSLN